MWACICLYECWRLGGWSRSFLQLLNTCGSTFKYCTWAINFSSAAFLGSCRLYKCRLYVATNTADTQWFIWCHWIHTFQSLIIKINTITKKEWKQKLLLKWGTAVCFHVCDKIFQRNHQPVKSLNWLHLSFYKNRFGVVHWEVYSSCAAWQSIIYNGFLGGGFFQDRLNIWTSGLWETTHWLQWTSVV